MDTTTIRSTFIENAALVSAIVHEVDDMEEAIHIAVKIASENPFCEDLMSAEKKGEKQKTIAAPNLDPKAYDTLSQLCTQNGLALIRDNLRKYPGGIEMGITCVDGAIAETGTLVLNSDSEEIRFSTMLCETHVAILNTSDIHETAQSPGLELSDRVKQQNSYTAFITGASRTADIERVLAIGVHGPLELNIILIGGGHGE